jgi:Protein of unknown function (DUF429)
MRILGIDFTSRPRRRKPMTYLCCTLEDSVLQAGRLDEWYDFEAFEAALRAPGPWIAGIDFPFAQSRRFIEGVGWPQSWPGYVSHTRALGRGEFRAALTAYKASRSDGDKEHRRQTDRAARSISPQKLYGVPVGLMFFEGAPRLLDAGVTIPHLHEGDPDRIVVEAYPGILARRLIGLRSYKNDSKAKQSEDQHKARRDMLGQIIAGALSSSFGLEIKADKALADDPSGDRLDALLCAIQAAWAWRMRSARYGAPRPVDPLEGWIADPSLKD